jgi:transcriptional regulator with XRE-family HTH domain
MDLVLNSARLLRHLRGLSQKPQSSLRRSRKPIRHFEPGERVGSLKLSQLARLLRIYDITEEQFFSRAIKELFDPNSDLAVLPRGAPAYKPRGAPAGR